jgi:hypothetical protein
MSNSIQKLPLEYNQSSITFPLNEESFKEWIVSLLGKPESIEAHLKGSFEIGMQDFIDICTVIDDRITNQNLSSLLEFKAKLFFDNDSSMTFNGVDSFINYVERRSLACTGFIFTWIYLVKFNNKQSSEKQGILISSVEEDINIPNIKRNLTPFYELLVDSDSEESFISRPQISYSVECTDKTWGLEIAELIRKCLTKSMKLKSYPYFKLRKVITDNFFRTYLFFPLLFVVYKLVTIINSSATKTCQNLIAKKSSLIGKGTTIEQKADFLIDVVSYCNNKVDTSFSILKELPIILAVIVSPFLIYFILKLPNFRFMIFTDESERKRQKYFKDLSGNRMIFGGLLSGIAASVIASYIYQYSPK